MAFYGNVGTSAGKFANNTKVQLVAAAVADELDYIKASVSKMPQSEFKGKKYGKTYQLYIPDVGTVKEGLEASPDDIVEVPTEIRLNNFNTSCTLDAWNELGDVEAFADEIAKPRGQHLARQMAKSIIENNVFKDMQAVVSNAPGFGVLSDGRIVAVTYEDSSDGPSRQVLVVLNRVDASSIQKKTELTLACFGLDYNLRSQIVKFNRSSADYRIVVKDYSEYATDDDYNAGLTKLNTEIISGNVPDLIANSMLLPIRQYAAKGLLEDLWPYIDADPEYSRDKLMTKPLESLQTDGKLYQLPIDFGVTTAIGLGKVVDGYDTWTLADVNDALSKLPEGATVFNKYYTQAEMLQYCVAMNADSFMNWQDGTCNFDSDEFRALLEFVKPFPAEYDWQSDSEEYESDYSRLKNGKQLLYPTSLYSFDDLYYTFAALNNDARFVGFPREDGSTGNAFNSDATLCITTTCRDKAGAWAFIRSTLEEDFQKSLWNFPILRSAFEANAKEAMTQEYETDADGNQILDENGNPIPISTGGMSYGDEPVIELYAVTQEQYDAVMAVIDSTTSFVDYDQNVLNIISDEAAGYLAGSKTAEEASKLIQSRVSLYIQEQK